MELPLRTELGTQPDDAVTWFRGEVWQGAHMLAHTSWTRHPHTAMNDGADLLRYCRENRDELRVIESEPIAKQSHDEALKLFALV